MAVMDVVEVYKQRGSDLGAVRHVALVKYKVSETAIDQALIDGASKVFRNTRELHKFVFDRARDLVKEEQRARFEASQTSVVKPVAKPKRWLRKCIGIFRRGQE